MIRSTHPAASQAAKDVLHKTLQLVAEALNPQLKPSPAFWVAWPVQASNICIDLPQPNVQTRRSRQGSSSTISRR